MVCEKCQKDYGKIIIRLRDKNGEQTFCPNCLAFTVSNGDLKIENDKTLRDDVTGKFGAVEYCSLNERYTLEKETMIRLICKNLTPEEWFALKEKYGADKFELHDDFYDEDGYAIQPMEI